MNHRKWWFARAITEVLHNVLMVIRIYIFSAEHISHIPQHQVVYGLQPEERSSLRFFNLNLISFYMISWPISITNTSIGH